MQKKKQELQAVINKIEDLHASLKKETDFFKQKFFKDEIKKYLDKKDSLEGKIRHLQELAGEMKTTASKAEESEKQISGNKAKEATQVNNKDLFNGPCHEEVKTAGGKGISEVHYYATEVQGENTVKLEYLNPNGKSTGLLAKTVSLDEFSKKYVSCVEHGCDIIKK